MYRPLSMLLSILMLFSVFSAAAPSARAANPTEDLNPWAMSQAISSAYSKTLPDVPEVESIDLSDFMSVDTSTILDMSSIKKAGDTSETGTGKAYIESVAKMLATPVGAMGFEGIDLEETVDVIVWLQELPNVLAEAYGNAQIPFVSNYASMAARARQSIRMSLRSSITFEYAEVFSGFAASVPASQVQSLAQMPGVFAVVPDTLMYADFTADPSYDFVGMQESRDALRIGDLHEAGITGDGVVVGVLDTGIDYNHPDLKDVYKGGWNFITAKADHDVRGRENNDPMETTYEQWERSGKDEVSSNGNEYYTSHGTHVSGTIAAQAANGDGTYKALGLAPDVDLWVARVLGPYGSGATAGIVAAVEDFAAEGGNLPKADVINLSLGANNDTAYGVDVYALNNAVIAGVNVAVSAGNNAGADAASRKTHTLGTPGTAYLPVTVAASQYGGTAVKSYDAATAAVGESSATFGLLLEGMDIRNTFENGKINGTPAPTYVEGKGYEAYLAFGPDDTNPTLDGLKAIPDGSLAGKILFVKRGISFLDFFAQAKRTGAGALVIVNSKANGEKYITNMVIGGANKDHLPIFSAYHSTSAKLTALAANGTVYVQLGALTAKAQAYEPAYFSSIGPVTETIGLKPDIIAPGWAIVSTQPAFITNPDHNTENYDGAYASMSGTSMSAPHIAGILALMKQQYPNATPAEIKARLMNTATPGKIKALADGTPASVLEVGAGFVNPYRALVADTSVYVTVADRIPGAKDGQWIENQTLSSLNFGTAAPGGTSAKLPVTVHGADAFTLSVVYNDGTRYSLSSVTNGVTLKTGQAKNGTFEAWVEVGGTAAKGLYEGYLVITAGANSYVVPWVVWTGPAPKVFSADYILSDRPIISTTEDTSMRASPYANATTLFFQYSGDKWPGGKTDIMLLSADSMEVVYYYGTLNATKLMPGTLYSLDDALGSQAYPVDVDGNAGEEKVTVADGAYYVAMSAGGNDCIGSGVVFTSEVPTLTTSSYISMAPDAQTLTFSGTIYSEALALAERMGFTWDDPNYALDEKFCYPVDQSWNVLAFSANAGSGELIFAKGTPYICDARGNFKLTIDGISAEARESWDYLFASGSNHALVGVDAYAYNYVGDLGRVLHGNAKSAPVTVRYGVLDPDAPSLVKTVGVGMEPVSDRTQGYVTVAFNKLPTDVTPENVEVSVTNNGLAVTGLGASGTTGKIMRWKFDLASANVEQQIVATVVHGGQTYTAECTIEPNGQPAPVLESAHIENGKLTATLANAPFALKATDFALAFTLENAPYQVGETTYRYSVSEGVGTVTWTFNPIPSSIYDRRLVAEVTYGGKSVQGETVLEKVLPTYAYRVELGVDPMNASVGDTIELNVYITGEESYAGYDMTVAYASDYLTYAGISDESAETVEDEGAIRFFKAGEQTEIGEAPVVVLSFTVKNTVVDSQPVEFALTQADVVNVGNPEDGNFMTSIGESVTAAVHNLTVTFRAGTGIVDFGTQTAYVKYNQPGLYTDNSYTEAFAIPAPQAKPGYQIVPPMWYDGAVSHHASEIEAAQFTETAAFTAVAEVQHYGFAAIPEGGIDNVTGLTATGQATYNDDITFTVSSAIQPIDELVATYTIGDGELVRLTAVDGTYTIPGAAILGDVTVRINVHIEGEVAYYEYNGAPEGYKLALLTVRQPAAGATYTVEDAPLFWSEYEAGMYAYIVPTHWTEQNFMDRLSYQLYTENGAAVSHNVNISYDGDVNRNGTVNIKDAQIAYDLYNENADYLGDNLSLLVILQRLEADVNADRAISMLDVRAIYSKMMPQ